MAKVTVLIPSYNPGRYLKTAVKSVLNQTYTNWQMVIIDDASTDNSIHFIKKELNDPRIKVFRNRKNLGQAKSLNVGLSYINTPYIIQLDADDTFEKNTLEKMVPVMDRLPNNVAVLSGNIRTVFENKTGNIVKTKIRRGRFFKNKYDFLLANTSVWPRFYRTSALKRVGGWPTNGPYEGRYIEDLRILFRLIEKYRFYWIDEVLYNHRRHLTNQTKERSPMVNTLEWLINDTLKRWGNQYKPQFRKREDGYIKVYKLFPNKKKY